MLFFFTCELLEKVAVALVTALETAGERGGTGREGERGGQSE